MKVKSSIKEQQIQKRRIYEILNESAVQTREDYDNVVMTGKGVEKSTWWNTRLTINDLVAHG